MGKSKYVITGFPSSMNVTKTPSISRSLGPVSREVANVEAEKGETVVTNMSRGLNNIYEMYAIGGKKHSKGGTPLALPTDDGDDTNGTSFIFSDNKKMIVKDPAILDYFGVTPGKPKTFAEISKSWLGSINKSKQIIMDENADKISKKSAEMTMDNASFKIAALKLLQESRKGFKDGVPNGLTPFFDKLQIDPNEMFAMNQQDADQTNQAVAMAMGGAARDFIPTVEDYSFPSLSMGGELPRYVDAGPVAPENTANESTKKEEPQLAWGSSDPKSLKQYDYIVNVLATNDKFKDALFAEYQKAANEKENFGKRYNASFAQDPKNKEKVIRKSKEEVFQDYLEFQKRNLMLKSHGYDVSSTAQNPVSGQVSNKDITNWSKSHGVPLPNIDKATSEQLSFIAFENLSKNRDIYDNELKAVMKPFGTNPYGLDDEVVAGSGGKRGRISKADGAYTNTTAGEISYFTEPEIIEPCPDCPDGTKRVRGADGNCPPCEPGDTPQKETPPKYKGLAQTAPLVNPYGFRREDIASLNRAVQAKFEIPELHPWAKSAEVVTADRAYYSPERTIAAKNEQLNQMMQGVNAFGTAQSAGATAMALSGQAYGDVANAISEYADKNVGVFNTGEQYNTQIANARNAKEAQLATSMHDKENILKQSLANSISAAKDKIVQLSNQAYTNASNIYNLNTTTENFKKDPFTGLITKVNDKAITPTATNSKDFGEEFNSFSKGMPTVSPDLQMKAFLAYKSGKYAIEPDDNVTKAEELRNSNLQS